MHYPIDILTSGMVFDTKLITGSQTTKQSGLREYVQLYQKARYIIDFNM